MCVTADSFRQSCSSLLGQLRKQKAGEPAASCSTKSWKKQIGSSSQHQDAGYIFPLRYNQLRGLCWHPQLCLFHIIPTDLA